MTHHPFQPPPVSQRHQDLLEEFSRFDDSKAIKQQSDKYYNRFRQTEAERYVEAAASHCSYCGDQYDGLQLDHFKPKGNARHQWPTETLIQYYRNLADSEEYGKTSIEFNEELFFISPDGIKLPEHYAQLCIDSNNLVPACADCNTPTAPRIGRNFLDQPIKYGKHDRFPLMQGTSEPGLKHPGKVGWRALLDLFHFVDVIGIPAKNAGFPGQGSSRSTIVIPRDLDSKECLQIAAITIHIFGLNRKFLAERRFQKRQMFRAMLSCPVGFNPAKAKTNQTISQFTGETSELTAKAAAIRYFLHSNPHKLALLDALKDWLREAFDSINDLDRFMSGTG